MIPPYPACMAPYLPALCPLSVLCGRTGLGSSRSDLDRFRLREVVESVKDVTKLDPHKLFVELFKATLNFRLNEDVFSRVNSIII